MQNLLYYQRTSEIPDEMLWKKSAEHQMCFVRDTICHGLLGWVIPFVISFHRSKSIILPVYGFTMKNGIKIICRDNFYDWKVSVKLPQPIGTINAIPKDLISSYGTDISDCYCEGFKDSWVYPAYKTDDHTLTEFTVEINNDYKLYTFMYFLKHLFTDINFDNEALMSKEEIAAEIDKIYDQQGARDMYEDGKHYKTGEPIMRSRMSSWEILWKTYNCLDSKVKYITDEKGYVHRDVDFDMHTPDDPMKFAEFIVNDPEAYKLFQFELYQYKQQY